MLACEALHHPFAPYGLTILLALIFLAAGPLELWFGPHLVPREEIEDMADEVMRDHPEDPEGWTRRRAVTTLDLGYPFEASRWRRVGRVIGQRLKAGG